MGRCVLRTAFFCLAVTGILQAAPILVGEWGRVETFHLTGVKAFSPEQVLEELAGDLEILPVLRQDALLESLLSTIEKRLAASYRELGFIEAAVSAGGRG